MQFLDRLTVTEIHVYPAWQAWVETADRPHDVDALEVLPIVLLEDRLPLNGILVRSGSAVAVPRIGIPRSGRIRMVVRDLSVPNHHVMAEHTAHRLGEAAADGLVGHRELLPGLRAPSTDLDQSLLREVQRAPGGVGLEVG